jgi:hypothetical protein
VRGDAEHASPEPTPDATEHRATSTVPEQPATPTIALDDSSKARNLRRTRLSDGELSATTSGPPKKKARNEERTIDFAEVYKDGDAKFKHAIIEHPKHSNKWYILRCDEHQVHFRNNAVLAAAKHLNGRNHGNLPRDWALAVSKLGIRVRDCTADMAKRNNEAFERALAAGYEPLNENRRSGRESLNRQPQADSGGQDNTQDHPMRGANHCSGITHPTVGTVYRAWYAVARAFYAVVLLPTGDFATAGISGSIKDTGLVKHPNRPACYLFNLITNTFSGWSDGYQDGGPFVSRRRFPVMYLLDSLDVPIEGEFPIPKGDLFDFVRATDLSPFSLDDPECQRARGYEAARAFLMRRDKIAAKDRGNASIEGRSKSL